MLAVDAVRNSVSRSPVNSELPDATANRAAITEVPVVKPDESSGNAGPGLLVAQLIQPTPDQISTIAGAVVPQFIHSNIVAYKLQAWFDTALKSPLISRPVQTSTTTSAPALPTVSRNRPRPARPERSTRLWY